MVKMEKWDQKFLIFMGSALMMKKLFRAKYNKMGAIWQLNSLYYKELSLGARLPLPTSKTPLLPYGKNVTCYIIKNYKCGKKWGMVKNYHFYHFSLYYKELEKIFTHTPGSSDPQIHRSKEVLMKKFSLVGIDGNVFVIIGYTEKAMRACGYTADEIKAYREKAMSSDYDNALAVSANQVSKCNGRLQ